MRRLAIPMVIVPALSSDLRRRVPKKLWQRRGHAGGATAERAARRAGRRRSNRVVSIKHAAIPALIEEAPQNAMFRGDNGRLARPALEKQKQLGITRADASRGGPCPRQSHCKVLARSAARPSQSDCGRLPAHVFRGIRSGFRVGTTGRWESWLRKQKRASPRRTRAR